MKKETTRKKNHSSSFVFMSLFRWKLSATKVCLALFMIAVLLCLNVLWHCIWLCYHIIIWKANKYIWNGKQLKLTFFSLSVCVTVFFVIIIIIATNIRSDSGNAWFNGKKILLKVLDEAYLLIFSKIRAIIWHFCT